MAWHTEAAMPVGGAVALLLYWKDPLHAFVNRIVESDFRPPRSQRGLISSTATTVHVRDDENDGDHILPAAR